MPSRTSINGWSVITSNTDPLLETAKIPGTNITICGRSRVLPLFLALAAEYNTTVAALREGECGMWNPRKARMANAWSDHASGTAIDLNWNHEGAMGAKGGMVTMTAAQIKECRRLRDKYQVVWGGDYHNQNAWDPMHFAIKPGYGLVAVGLVISSLGIKADGTVKPALNNIMSNSVIINMTQRALNKTMAAGLVVDGILGPKTSAAIKDAERKYGLPTTGKTSARLLVKLGVVR